MKGETQAETASALGLTRSTYANYETNANQPKSDVINKILGHFGVTFEKIMSEDFTIVHLNKKQGEAKKQKNVHLNVHPSVHLKGKKQPQYQKKGSWENRGFLNEVHEQSGKQFAPVIITVDSVGNENILYVPVKARAGYLSGYADPEFITTLPAYRLPGYNNGSYRIFEVQGISMFPTFQDKDRCVTRWAQVSDIRDDRVYVLITRNDGLLIKRLINRSQEGKIICKSDNNHTGEFPAIVLDVSEIMEVWYVVERWTRQLPGPGEIYKRIVNLEAELTLIKHRLSSSG